MSQDKPDPNSIPDYDKWQLSNEEWKERLSPEAYAVLRKEATERPGSSPLDNEKRDGVFACAGCGSDLFNTDQKFDSGTGWPSFYPAHGISLRALRRPSGPRLQGRSRTDRVAILQ